MNQTPFVPTGRAAGFGRTHRARGQEVKNRQPTVRSVCRNLAEARRDAEQRPVPSSTAARQARPSATRLSSATAVSARYLKTVSAEHFAVDEARVAEDARSDGLYVLRPNSPSSPRFRSCCLTRDATAGRAVVPPATGRACQSPIYHSSGHGHSRPRVLLLPCPLLASNSRIASTGTTSQPNRTTSCGDLDRLAGNRACRMASASCCAPRPPRRGKLFQAAWRRP